MMIDPMQIRSVFCNLLAYVDVLLTLGDRLAFRCTMMNLGEKYVGQGLASTDEMCDLYLMYWTVEEEGGGIEGNNFCWSRGLPDTTWQSLGFNNIPAEETSRY